MLDYRPTASTLPVGAQPMRGVLTGIGSIVNVWPASRPVTAEVIRRRAEKMLEAATGRPAQPK